MTDSNKIGTEIKATVTTITGDVKKFTDSFSAYIAVHPKTGAIICLVAGWVFGWFIHP